MRVIYPKDPGELLGLLPKREALGEFYLVGGAVRDWLLGKRPEDFDVLVRARVAEVAARYRDAVGGALIELDKNTWRVVSGRLQVDFTKIQGSLKKDLTSRDFTVNSIAVSWKGKLLDPAGGLEDLARGLLRSLRKEILEEDPLRALRAIRFRAELGFEIEGQTFQWIREVAPLLDRVSPERIHYELLLVFSAPGYPETADAFLKSGLLLEIFPELEPMDQVVGETNLLLHSLEASKTASGAWWHLDYTPFKPFRKHLKVLEDGHWLAVWVLASLLHDVGKPQTLKEINGQVHFYGHEALGARMVRRRARALRFSKKEVDALSLLVKEHMHPHFLANPTRRALNRFLRRTGEWAFPLVLMAYADALATPLSHQGTAVHVALAKALHDFILEQEAEKKKAPRLVTGYDLIAMGLKPGPVFKELLQEIDDLRAEGAVKTREEALAKLRELVAQRGLLPPQGEKG